MGNKPVSHSLGSLLYRVINVSGIKGHNNHVSFEKLIGSLSLKHSSETPVTRGSHLGSITDARDFTYAHPLRSCGDDDLADSACSNSRQREKFLAIMPLALRASEETILVILPLAAGIEGLLHASCSSNRKRATSEALGSSSHCFKRINSISSYILHRYP
jgi:hypothetical protein